MKRARSANESHAPLLLVDRCGCLTLHLEVVVVAMVSECVRVYDIGSESFHSY